MRYVLAFIVIALSFPLVCVGFVFGFIWLSVAGGFITAVEAVPNFLNGFGRTFKVKR